MLSLLPLRLCNRLELRSRPLRLPVLVVSLALLLLLLLLLPCLPCPCNTAPARKRTAFAFSSAAARASGNGIGVGGSVGDVWRQWRSGGIGGRVGRRRRGGAREGRRLGGARRRRGRGEARRQARGHLVQRLKAIGREPPKSQTVPNAGGVQEGPEEGGGRLGWLGWAVAVASVGVAATARVLGFLVGPIGSSASTNLAISRAAACEGLRGEGGGRRSPLAHSPALLHQIDHAAAAVSQLLCVAIQAAQAKYAATRATCVTAAAAVAAAVSSATANVSSSVRGCEGGTTDPAVSCTPQHRVVRHRVLPSLPPPLRATRWPATGRHSHRRPTAQSGPSPPSTPARGSGTRRATAASRQEGAA